VRSEEEIKGEIERCEEAMIYFVDNRMYRSATTWQTKRRTLEWVLEEKEEK